MRTVLAGIVVGIGTLVASLAAVAADAPAAEIRVAVELSDGSKMIGIPGVATISVKSEIGKLDVPFAKVKSMSFREDHEGITVILINGDQFSGTHSLGRLELKTIVGSVTIDAAVIRRIAAEPVAPPKPESH